MAVPWTQAEAIALCRDIEAICPAYGCHVALTGGTLYRDGERKDADILFYRIRQVPAIDIEGLFGALAAIGVERKSGFGWCIKAEHRSKSIDCFFPEADGDDYHEIEAGDPDRAREEDAEQVRIDAMFSPIMEDF